jgi:two-component system OmpR family sensor kinase
VVFVLLLSGLLGYFYYRSQEQLMFSHQRIRMMEYASTQARRRNQLHRHYPQEKRYPRDARFESAIYDLEYQKIFSTLKGLEVHLDEVIYHSGDNIHLIKILDDYYLGAKYLVIEVPEEKAWYQALINKILLYALPLLVLLMLLGVYLSRLFVRPMRNSIMLLDRFIKDTTHELNTPLSAILANIEMMDRERMTGTNAKKLNRIEIGARTVSTLYEDLKFLTLESNKPIEDETVDLLPMVENRLEYFTLLMQSKNIRLYKELVPSMITIDKRLITRVIDNLLSNAIKYNKRGGVIDITLEEGCLIIADSGIGIQKEKLGSIFERYSRFNESEGGFGIGLNIVKKIIDHYGMEIIVESELDHGTKVILRWSEQ